MTRCTAGSTATPASNAVAHDPIGRCIRSCPSNKANSCQLLSDGTRTGLFSLQDHPNYAEWRQHKSSTSVSKLLPNSYDLISWIRVSYPSRKPFYEDPTTASSGRRPNHAASILKEENTEVGPLSLPTVSAEEDWRGCGRARTRPMWTTLPDRLLTAFTLVRWRPTFLRGVYPARSPLRV